MRACGLERWRRDVVAGGFRGGRGGCLLLGWCGGWDGAGRWWLVGLLGW